MADFRQALKKILENEGGYIHHPADRGGETYKGIARTFHPQWIGWQIIDNLKKEKKLINTIGNKELCLLITKLLEDNEQLQKYVELLYRSFYWNRLQLDEEQSQLIAEKLFDIAVNMGVERAREFRKQLKEEGYAV
jgi:lysozyme family protein